MLSLSFQTTVLATAQILLMGACGYFLVKKGIVDEAGLDLLTRLLVKFFLPLFMFYQLTGHFSFSDFPDWWLYPLLGVAIAFSGLVVGKLALFCCPFIKTKREFLSLIVFQNSGYIPLMLVTTLFSGEVANRLYVSIFLLLIGFNAMMWSLGVWLLARPKRTGLDVKSFYNPPLIAIIGTLFIIFLGIHKYIPKTIMVPIQLFNQCALPLAMIVIGGALATIKLTHMPKRPIAMVCFAKLIVLPLVAFGVVFAFRLHGLIGFLIVLEAVVPSAVTLSVIARYYQGDETFVNQGIFYSHVLSVITMPAFLLLYSTLIKTI